MSAYSTPEMRQIWSDENMLDTWRIVELAIIYTQSRLDPEIPKDWWVQAFDAPLVHVDEWQTETAISGHELVAFLECWGATNVHIGITSSDVTDTALGLRIKDTNTVLLNRLNNLHEAIRVKIAEVGTVRRMGRTHGQAATVMTLGQMLANWDLALERSSHRLASIRRQVEVCMVSGPVGSYLHTRRDVELHTASALGLNPAESSTQIVMRDGLAAWAAELAIIASLVEAIGTEIRLMQHAQVAEAVDPAGSTSSAMAHKTNPNRAERLCGLGRLARAAFEPLAAGIPQWHERDMSHSSVERVLIPQLVGVTDYGLQSAASIINDLQFDFLQIATNMIDYEVELLCHSAQTALQKAGVPYLEAHRWVEKNYPLAHTPLSFVQSVLSHHSQPDFEWPTTHTTHLLED